MGTLPQIYIPDQNKAGAGASPPPRSGQRAPPDDGQLGEGHRRQHEPVWEGEELHGPGTLGGVVLQALCHILFF